MSDMTVTDAPSGFAALGLPAHILATVEARGYTNPSPIQAETIPPLLAGRDILGQAQTGTGKTAAFALPLLARIDTAIAAPQVLILAPTRELAIQVAESCQTYGKDCKGLRVACLYGGASYMPQLQSLRRGAQVVVGTPGRLIDHLDRGTLVLNQLRALVLDEADEMLRMGFIEDVTRIAEACPAERQTALFSATMPPAIRNLARKQTRDPLEIAIKADHSQAALIRQRAAIIPYRDKTDALLRLLAMETTDGVIVFVATKVATTQVAEALAEHGIKAAQLSGDVAQRDREYTVERFTKGAIDVLVATDVAARGLDVDRVSHVINYDLPPDVETYTHRIGRTGRAGRSGEAIAFANPSQRYILNNIIRRTGNDIEPWEKPSAEAVNRQRLQRFGQDILSSAEQDRGLDAFRELITSLRDEHQLDPVDAAAVVARMMIGDAQAFRDQQRSAPPRKGKLSPREQRQPPASKAPAFAKAKAKSKTKSKERVAPSPLPEHRYSDEKSLYALGVGHRHGATPARILAAVAGASGLDGRAIGRIAIGHDSSVIELPSSLPRPAMKALKKTQINGHSLDLSHHPDSL